MKGFERYSFVAKVRKTHSVLCTTLVKRRAATEQPALASLESELSDSASFGYLRRRFATVQRRANPFHSAKK
jgi:hypothetical protein